MTKILDKRVQLNCITDNPAVGKHDAVWEPRYSTNEALIACYKVDRSKLDIKLRFSKVNHSNEWAGDWFLSRKTCRRFKKRFDNNGMLCYAVPLKALERLEFTQRSQHDW